MSFDKRNLVTKQIHPTMKGIGDLILPVIDEAIKSVRAIPESVIKNTELILPEAIKNSPSKNEVSTFLNNKIKSLKEATYNGAIKVAKFFGMESLVDKAAQYIGSATEFIGNVFQDVKNFFLGNNSQQKSNDAPKNDLTSINTNNISQKPFNDLLRSEQEMKNGGFSQLIGFEGLRQNNDAVAKKEDKTIVDRLQKYGEGVIDVAQAAYLKLQLLFNKIRHPEVAKVEKMLSDSEKKLS